MSLPKAPSKRSSLPSRPQVATDIADSSSTITPDAKKRKKIEKSDGVVFRVHGGFRNESNVQSGKSQEGGSVKGLAVSKASSVHFPGKKGGASKLYGKNLNDLKIWLEANRPAIHKSNYELSKIPKELLRALFRGNKDFISLKDEIQAFLSEAAKLAAATSSSPPDEAASTSNRTKKPQNEALSASSKSAEEAQSSKPSRVKSDDNIRGIKAKLLKLTQFGHPGGIKSVACVSEFVSTMKELPLSLQTLLSPLDTILQSKPTCLSEFARVGGVTVLASWLECACISKSVTASRPVIEGCLKVLEKLPAHEIAQGSQINKVVARIARQSQDSPIYLSPDEEFVNRAAKLLASWRAAYHSASEEGRFHARQHLAPQKSLNSYKPVTTSFKSSELTKTSAARGGIHTQSNAPNYVEKNKEKAPSKLPESENLVLSILNVMSEEEKNRKMRKIKLRDAKLEAEIKTLAAQKQQTLGRRTMFSTRFKEESQAPNSSNITERKASSGPSIYSKEVEDAKNSVVFMTKSHPTFQQFEEDTQPQLSGLVLSDFYPPVDLEGVIVMNDNKMNQAFSSWDALLSTLSLTGPTADFFEAENEDAKSLPIQVLVKTPMKLQNFPLADKVDDSLKLVIDALEKYDQFSRLRSHIRGFLMDHPEMVHLLLSRPDFLNKFGMGGSEREEAIRDLQELCLGVNLTGVTKNAALPGEPVQKVTEPFPGEVSDDKTGETIYSRLVRYAAERSNQRN